MKSYLFIFLGLFFLQDSIIGEDKPNVLFIAIDDMNDWTGFLGGHPQAITPNMDALARKGVNFTNAHCSAPGCSPSRNSLLFGKEPFHSGLYCFYDGEESNKKLVSQYTTLPEFFKTNGFNTYGSGKIHHGQKEAPEKEWTQFHSPQKHKLEIDFSRGIQGRKGKYNCAPSTSPLENHLDFKNTTFGVEILSKEHDKPFFLAVGIINPHLPFVCPEQFWDALPEPIDPPERHEEDLRDIPWAGRDFLNLGEVAKYNDNKQWNTVRKAYLGCISWADYNVGRLIKALEKSPYANNTIVVLWSDHGYHLGEKTTFKKFTLWEESTRVPFIIHDTRAPKSLSGRKIEEAVSLINIYKTLADLSGLPIPENLDGYSLKPYLEDPSKTILKPAITSWGRGNYAVRSKDWRYIKYFDGTEELYSHKQDPNEWTNLAKNPELEPVKQKLRESLPNHESASVPNWALWSSVGADKEDSGFKILKRDWKKSAKRFNPPLPQKVQ